MTEDHEHTHRVETECAGDDCDHKRSEQYSHTHESGHDFHVHRPEGAKLIKVEEEIEEPKPRSSIWHGDE